MPRFITSCLLGEPLRVHGDGSAMRDWTHVDDTCAALDCLPHGDLAPLRGEVINIGSGESIALSEIARSCVQDGRRAA